MIDREKGQDGQEANGPSDEFDAAVQKELEREAEEGQGLIGDEAKNRNLTGSSTWETLTDPTDAKE
jgi:hypothetical protein